MVCLNFIDKRLRRIGLPYIVFVPLITILFILIMIGGFFVDWDSINIMKRQKRKLEMNLTMAPLVYVFFTNFYFSLFGKFTYFSKKISFRININYCLIAIIQGSYFLSFFNRGVLFLDLLRFIFFPHLGNIRLLFCIFFIWSIIF
ncbi:MAG: hypothetical protein Ct9H90mP2_12950 [Dehalococcoidia bacterium]|nr:MAG: hypothetical protein Ct9H90mP2_12950 [Dehalococcoidia bacterium]